MMKPLSILTNSALALSLLFHAAQAQEPFDRRKCLSDIGHDVQSYSKAVSGKTQLRGPDKAAILLIEADLRAAAAQCKNLDKAEAVHITDCLYATARIAEAQAIDLDGLVQLQLRLAEFKDNRCIKFDKETETPRPRR